MKLATKFIAACAISAGAMSVFAQNSGSVDPHNVVQISASASVEVVQDLLTLTLSVTREGADATQVQSQLKQALEPALVLAKKQASPGGMDVRTGAFSLQPRYGRDSRISTWIGTAELVLEGRDAERIATTAGRVQGMTVSSALFSLSREQRQSVESQVQAAAIERFRARATEVARSFGFGTYGLREVSVSGSEQGFYPRARMLAAEPRAMAADAAVPVEAGKTTVQVNVQGSIQLLK